MMVARQFIAWYPCENGNRPVGNGMIGSTGRSYSLGGEIRRAARLAPSLRDAWPFRHIPGNKLLGYHHSVPPGQKIAGLARPNGQTRSLLAKTPPILVEPAVFLFPVLVRFLKILL